jgi:hypothetical protein
MLIVIENKSHSYVISLLNTTRGSCHFLIDGSDGSMYRSEKSVCFNVIHLVIVLTVYGENNRSFCRIMAFDLERCILMYYVMRRV